MSIIKSIPSQRLVNGKVLFTSEVSVVTGENFYQTNGEECIIAVSYTHLRAHET